jgi:hypothetical protein
MTAVMLSMARGQHVPSDEVRSLWAGPFTSVRDYVASVTATNGSR